MKLSVSAMRQALKNANLVAEARSSVSIISCVQLKATGPHRMRIRANNLDMMLDQEIDCEVPPSQSICINAKALERALKHTRGDTVKGTLANELDRISLSLGHIDLTLPVRPGEDMPDFNSGLVEGEGVAFNLAADDLQAMLQRVEYAISTEATRYYLNGAYLHHRKGHISAVATDGHRLALRDGPSAPEKFFGKIIPAAGVQALIQLMKSCVDDIFLQIGDEDRLRIRVAVGDDIIFHSQTIDGTFPDYPRVIPKNAKSKDKLRVDPRELRALCTAFRALLANTGKYAHDSVKFEPNGTGLYLTRDDPEQGAAKAHLPVLSGKPEHVLGFRLRHLIDALKGKQGETQLQITSPSSAMVIGDASSGDLDVVMPVRV